MEVTSGSRSPREEGELEDGEICDDETEESVPLRRGEGSRSGGAAPPRTRKPHQHPHCMPPHMGLPPPDFRLLMPYNLGHHGHGPFPPALRQQCGPSGPDRPPSPLPPLPGLPPHGEISPRSSFWERSHGALGRFRHRAMPNGGRGAWNRGGRGGRGGRAPVGRHGPGQNRGNKTESPSRKQNVLGRNQVRKVSYGVSRAENVDESFEDLLSKYKQIQLELECIRKEETMALEPKASPARENQTGATETGPGPEAARGPEAAQQEVEQEAEQEEAEQEKAETKAFQAFNIKPLRQKLFAPAHLEPLKEPPGESDPGGGAERLGEEEERSEDGAEAEPRREPEEQETCPCCGDEDGEDEKDKREKTCLCCRESASSEDSAVSPDKPVVKVEEEELSELQLRLLALQSASKKWQQKEQQVMKKSKDRITRTAQEKKPGSGPGSGPGPGAAPPNRQRITTRSASSAAAAAVERSRTRSKPLDRDRTKTGPRPLDRERLPERDRPKQSPKPGPKAPQQRGRTPAKKMISPGSAAKQAFRKQQLRTWKLQQQREQEEKRRQDEDERRKREDEIRQIRDLSNQDEQYNRFMSLVGGKSRTYSKSRDREHRKSAGKPGLDASGNLYQYDNYDEVAMDTDSETGSPVSSPTHDLFTSDAPGGFRQTLYLNESAPFGLTFVSPVQSGVVPPPPPLPPPPDEMDPPPKPPFADEEEEEEMLLRETCLMSMANKRVMPEETSSSAPPSPGHPPPAGAPPPPRGNLSLVSLNSASQPRTNKFTRGHHAPRALLVLPRHKSVVVSLNASDDSDSDVDACSATQTVFGGLEFMIKEARRTVEAAKPKEASGSEKENNPVRTPEALPDAKKAEYRQLKEEIASREKLKMLKDHSQAPWSSAPSAASETVVDSGRTKMTMEAALSAAEQRLNKNRELLQRDETVLRQLLQQELKKKESLKAAEAKVAKLREQLQASEKIVGANKTLLKKLQEQVLRVEHRVSIKKSLSTRLEQELVAARLATGRGSKRRTDANQAQPRKLLRVDMAPPSRGSERHLSLIAQKQRLQQLESEYALKIQRLKETQALHNRGVPAEPVLEPPPRASTPQDPPDPPVQAPPRSGPFPLPQPSLHDLTQDKLTLDSEDVAEVDDQEPEPSSAARGPRRPSLRQNSCSFTKPNLEQPKDGSSSKPVKASSGVEVPPEMFAGLDLNALKLRYQQQARLGQLLQSELHKLGQNTQSAQVVSVEVDVTTSPLASTELKPVPFGPYHSPLLVFRSYRFSPYYRTKEKLSLSSVTYSNTIEPRKCFCRFDLTGTCNDDDCRWQHMRNCSLTGTQLSQDILSYDLSLIDCCDSSSHEDVAIATETYMKKLFGTNKDRMGLDQKAVLLVSKVNESKRHVPPFTTCKDARRWRPKPSALSVLGPEDDGEHKVAAGNISPGGYDVCSQTSLSALDVCVTSEDKRYFVSETDDISNLESSVLENPRDTQLWIKLAFKYLSQKETSAAECLEAALNTLSRALESNCENPEVWSHYLSLFSRRGSRDEVQEMCEMAVEHAPDHRVWWNYLTLENSFEGKDFVCERLLQFLLSEASPGASDKRSFQLMEVLLHRVQLHLLTGRMESARAVLQSSLKSAHNSSIADHVTAADRALLWLCYIHLTEFDRLPSSLFDPAESGPSRLVSRESFLLPWRTPQDISTPLNILIALFQDAIGQCSDESLSQSERTLACLPLHSNFIFFNKLLQRYDEALVQCESLLELCPESCVLRDALADLHLSKGDGDRAVSMWLHTLAECPNNAAVFYHSCKFLMAQEKSSAVVPLFRGFILSLCEDEQSPKNPVDVLRHILGFPSEELLRRPVVKKDVKEQLGRQTPYLHLIHCRWQWLQGSVERTLEAFERALGCVLPLDELHRLWMDFLLFSGSQQNSRLFSDLVQRCLSTVPTRLEVPFNPAEFWSCFHFHNQVVSLYLSCLPQSQHALLLERLRYAMPNNTELGLRCVSQEFLNGNMDHVKFQSRMLCSNSPKCSTTWKIAIAVETELQERSEVRLLYQQALLHLPLCAALWKDRLLWEAAEGAPPDRLRRLVDWCQQVGVSLVEVQAQGEDV